MKLLLFFTIIIFQNISGVEEDSKTKWYQKYPLGTYLKGTCKMCPDEKCIGVAQYKKKPNGQGLTVATLEAPIWYDHFKKFHAEIKAGVKIFPKIVKIKKLTEKEKEGYIKKNKNNKGGRKRKKEEEGQARKKTKLNNFKKITETEGIAKIIDELTKESPLGLPFEPIEYPEEEYRKTWW